MPAPNLRPRLHVEGPDDLHAIAGLVKRYGIDYKINPSAPEIKSIVGIDNLLDGIETAVPIGGGRTLGFVLDADDPLADRWASVRQRLAKVEVADIPPEPPDGGFIGESARFKSRVGVWLMPDNRRAGALELFLRDLVSEDDPIFEHARLSTEQATLLGAGFRPIDTLKATIHTWLAWQENPGLPYGTAITARYFQHDHPVARRFVEWYETLYQLFPAV